MKGLLKKDLLMMKSYGRSFLIILCVFSGVSLFSVDNSFFSGMCIVLMAMQPITSIAYDEQIKWDSYALSLPVTRKQMVAEKYLFALLLLTAGGVLAVAVGTLSAAIHSGQGTTLSDVLISVAALLGIGLWAVGLMLPLVYRFGVEKSRIFMFLIFGTPALGVALLANSGLSEPSEQILLLILGCICGAGIPVFCSSYFISLAIYRKKQF